MDGDRRTDHPHGRRRTDVLRAYATQLAITAALCFAVALGSVAYVLVKSFEDRLQAAAYGECYRVQVLRWEIDRKWYVDWRRDQIAGRLLQHGISHAVRTLGHDERRGAHQATLLAPSDCTLAVLRPAGYKPPPPIPFALARPAYLRCFLATPPALPGHGESWSRCGPARRRS